MSLYFQKSTIYALIGTAAALLLFAPWMVKPVVVLLVGLALVIFRIRPNPLSDAGPSRFKQKQGTLFAPLSAEVLDIVIFDEMRHLVLRPDFFSDLGVRLPVEAELEDHNFRSWGLFQRMKSCWAGRVDPPYSGEYNFRFRAQNARNFSLGIIRSPLTATFRVWALVGDRGKAGAPFGYFLGSGLVILSFPARYPSFINKGESITAAETAVCGLWPAGLPAKEDGRGHLE